MRVLVTGFGGFIGRAVWNALPDELEHYAIRHGDIAAKWLGPRSFDVCIHLAGNGDPARSVIEPDYDLDSHAGYVCRVIEKFSIDKFVYVSSGAVYDGHSGPVSPAIECSPRLPYAIAKLTAEQYVKAAAWNHRIGSYTIARFFGAYGSGEPERKIYTRLVRNFGIERKPDFTVRGNGENLIDAMYIDDAVRAICDIAQDDYENETLDLYAGESMTVNALVERAAACFGIKPEVRHDGRAAEYNRFFSTDRTYPFKPTVGLGDGLERLHRHLAGGT
jgi:nucleoside-diphosphate-sugar epimerase